MRDTIRDILPDRLNRPDHFAAVADRHRKAFAWEGQGYIPLGVMVNDPAHSAGLTYDRWLQPEVFLTLQAKMLRDTLEVGSDVNPTFCIAHMGNAIWASIWNTRITAPRDEVSCIQDTGPWIFPAIRDIREVDELGVPDVRSELVRTAERFMTFYRENLPDWVKVISPSKIAAFSLAELIRGSDFYLDAAVEPERCLKLVMLCAESLAAAEKHFRSVAGQGDEEFYSQFMIAGLGLRLGEDSLINVSPEMIRRFVLPALTRTVSDFGGKGYLHFCTLEKSRAEHVYPVLAEAPDVFAASSQFAFEYYEQHVDELEGRLAIESFYGDALAYVTRKYGSFEAWARQFVPKFRDRSGLILYFEVPSVEEGKRCLDVWRSLHNG